MSPKQGAVQRRRLLGSEGIMTAGRLALEFPADFWDVLPGKLLSSVEGYATQFRVPVSRYSWMFPPHAMKVEDLQAAQDG